jgi:hypothetical protein
MAISGSEDCLFLNIYTQSLPSQDMQADTPLRFTTSLFFRAVRYYRYRGEFLAGIEQLD